MASPKVGDRAPDFELPGTGGRSYGLAEHEGRGVVLAFYPGDFTRVCTLQLCSYRDEGARLDALAVPVLGISPQSVDSHERFREEKRLNVPLLADEDLAVAKRYGVRGWATPLAKVAGLATTAGGWYVQRSIFVIDGDLVIRYRHVSRTGATFQTVEDLERAVAAIR
jgi:peroxiredoxin Q/BCP